MCCGLGHHLSASPGIRVRLLCDCHIIKDHRDGDIPGTGTPLHLPSNAGVWFVKLPVFRDWAPTTEPQTRPGRYPNHFFYWTTGPSTFLTPTKTHQGRRCTPSLTSVPLPRRIRFGYQRRNIYTFSTSLPHHRKTHEVNPGVNHLYSCLYYGKIVSNSPPHYLTRNPTEVDLGAYTAHLVAFTTATSTRTSKTQHKCVLHLTTLPSKHHEDRPGHIHDLI